jgi:hypothetical protein
MRAGSHVRNPTCASLLPHLQLAVFRQPREVMFSIGKVLILFVLLHYNDF